MARGRSAEAGGGTFDCEPLEVIDFPSLEGQPVPEQPWLWEDWVPLHGVTILTGEGGIGKSSLALQLATACATGHPFLGHKVMRCKVLVIACEDPRNVIWRRQVQINAGLNVSMADLENLHVVSRAGQESSLMKWYSQSEGGTVSPFFEQVEAKAKEIGAQLVVLDTLADLFEGNENIRPQVRTFMAALTKLAMRIDGAVMLLSHPSQAGKMTGSGESGSTAWNNSARSRLNFTGDKAAGSSGSNSVKVKTDPDARTLKREKSNYARAGAQITMRLVNGVFLKTGENTGEDAWSQERHNKAKAAFIAGLNELNERKDYCSSESNQANYAPKKIEANSLKAKGFTADELAAALKDLLTEGKVIIVERGRRRMLEVANPDLGDL